MSEERVKSVWSRPMIVRHSIATITANNGGSLTDGQVVNHNIQSDRRLKADVRPSGRLPNGLKLYKFRYNWSEETLVGVMAQEVQDIMPDAVSMGEDGYMRVDYSKVGVTMISVDKYRQRMNQLI